MNSTPDTFFVRDDVRGIRITFSVERTGVGRNLSFAGRMYFDGAEVENRAHIGKNKFGAEEFMRSWCERLTEAEVLQMAADEVEGELQAIADRQAALDARKARTEALAKKIGAAAAAPLPCHGSELAKALDAAGI
jgi:hypothetical protein